MRQDLTTDTSVSVKSAIPFLMMISKTTQTQIGVCVKIETISVYNSDMNNLFSFMSQL